MCIPARSGVEEYLNEKRKKNEKKRHTRVAEEINGWTKNKYSGVLEEKNKSGSQRTYLPGPYRYIPLNTRV